MTGNFFIIQERKKNILSLAILAIAAFYCALPLFVYQGLPFDTLFHLFQANQFNRAIHDGFFYPRWAPDSNSGYGSATFIFYSPLSYYFVSAINLLIHSIVLSMVIAVWSGFFLSGITMFIATIKMFGRSGSLLAAVVYQILPFHLIDLYIRGTFAELFSFIWFPLIILFMYNSLESRGGLSFVGLSISYAGLILTHLVSGFIFTFVMGAYLIYYYFLKDKKPVLKTLLSSTFGLGLSSAYLMPVVFERKFVRIDYLTKCPVCDYRKNFLFTLDKFQGILQDFYKHMHLGVILEILLLLLIILVVREKVTPSNRQQNFFIFLFLFSLFLTEPLSKPVWAIIPGFPFLQFPWRWLPVMEFSLCLLIGSVFPGEAASGLRYKSLKKRSLIYILIIIIFLSFFMIDGSMISTEEVLGRVLFPEQIKKYMEPTVEYTPVWAKNIEKIISEERHEKVSVLSGSASVDITGWKSEQRAIAIEASTQALLRISTFYYPGWEAEIDGKKTEVMIENDTGAMMVDVPEGKHKLVMEFRDTPLRYFSKGISLGSFLILITYVFYSMVRRNHDKVIEGFSMRDR